jgi:hypothetical protein
VCSFFIPTPVSNHALNVQKVSTVDDVNKLTINEDVVASNFPCDCLRDCIPLLVSSPSLIDDMQVTNSSGSAHPDLFSSWHKPNIKIWAKDPTIKSDYYYHIAISVMGAVRKIEGPYLYEVKCLNV